MSQVIKPTNGRIVWFTPGGDFPGRWHDITKPLAAMVCHVWSDRMVNLDVVDSEGLHWSASSVDLIQPGDNFPKALGRYCEWMPYQGQAAKAEPIVAGNVPGCLYPRCGCTPDIAASRGCTKRDPRTEELAKHVAEINPQEPKCRNPDIGDRICGAPNCGCP